MPTGTRVMPEGPSLAREIEPKPAYPDQVAPDWAVLGEVLRPPLDVGA